MSAADFTLGIGLALLAAAVVLAPLLWRHHRDWRRLRARVREVGQAD